MRVVDKTLLLLCVCATAFGSTHKHQAGLRGTAEEVAEIQARHRRLSNKKKCTQADRNAGRGGCRGGNNDLEDIEGPVSSDDKESLSDSVDSADLQDPVEREERWKKLRKEFRTEDDQGWDENKLQDEIDALGAIYYDENGRFTLAYSQLSSKERDRVFWLSQFAEDMWNRQDDERRARAKRDKLQKLKAAAQQKKEQLAMGAQEKWENRPKWKNRPKVDNPKQYAQKQKQKYDEHQKNKAIKKEEAKFKPMTRTEVLNNQQREIEKDRLRKIKDYDAVDSKIVKDLMRARKEAYNRGDSNTVRQMDQDIIGFMGDLQKINGYDASDQKLIKDLMRTRQKAYSAGDRDMVRSVNDEINGFMKDLKKVNDYDAFDKKLIKDLMRTRQEAYNAGDRDMVRSVNDEINGFKKDFDKEYAKTSEIYKHADDNFGAEERAYMHILMKQRKDALDRGEMGKVAELDQKIKATRDKYDAEKEAREKEIAERPEREARARKEKKKREEKAESDRRKRIYKEADDLELDGIAGTAKFRKDVTMLEKKITKARMHTKGGNMDAVTKAMVQTKIDGYEKQLTDRYNLFEKNVKKWKQEKLTKELLAGKIAPKVDDFVKNQDVAGAIGAQLKLMLKKKLDDMEQEGAGADADADADAGVGADEGADEGVDVDIDWQGDNETPGGPDA